MNTAYLSRLLDAYLADNPHETSKTLASLGEVSVSCVGKSGYPAHWPRRILELALDRGLSPDHEWTSQERFRVGLEDVHEALEFNTNLVLEVIEKSQGDQGVDILEMLIQKGAKAYDADDAIYLALNKRAHLNILLDSGGRPKREHILSAIKSSPIDVVDLLLQGGGWTQEYTSGDEPFLSLMLGPGDIGDRENAVIQCLLSHGADPNQNYALLRHPVWVRALFPDKSHLLPSMVKAGARPGSKSVLHQWVLCNVYPTEDEFDAEKAAHTLDLLIGMGASIHDKEDGESALNLLRSFERTDIARAMEAAESRKDARLLGSNTMAAPEQRKSMRL